MFGCSSCSSLSVILVLVVTCLCQPMVGHAQGPPLEDDLENAVEALVEQLENQLEHHLDKGTLPEDSQMMVFQVKHQTSGLRWKLSEVLEEQLISEISAETNFVLLSFQKTKTLRQPYWREMLQGEDYQVALKITKAAQIPLVLLGTFVIQQNTIRLQLQLIATQNEETYASLKIGLATNEISEDWLKPLPLYQNRAHLETARAFIAEEEWELAKKELQQVSDHFSFENLEAQGLLIWLLARSGQSITETFIPFKTRHPEHPLVLHIEQEWKKQQILKYSQQALQQKDWVLATRFLENPVLKQGDPQVVENHQSILEREAIQWSYALLKQKRWKLLHEQWPLLLQVVKSVQGSPLTTLKQETTHRFFEELQGFIQRQNRTGGLELLDQFGTAFLSKDQQQQAKTRLLAIPLPPPGMVTLPATTFEMGSKDGKIFERPVHQVILDAYHLDQYEVTNQDYQACVAAKHCSLHSLREDERFNGGRQPVVGVTWHQAHQYCRWKNKRLPTEAEWERAAENLQPLEDYAWFDENSGKRTREVGTRKPNTHGLYDLRGNALEWVQDYYAADYYAWSPENNPHGPVSGDLKAARGGSWYHAREGSCSQCRYFWSPSLAFNFFGFRCADSLE